MINIDSLKEILKDNSLHIGLGVIKRLHLAEDRSYLKVTLSVFPEQREIIAEMSWDSVGPDAGDFDFPSPGDMALFAQAEGSEDFCYIIKRLTSKEDTIPQEATTGDKVHRAKLGKKYWNISNTNIYLSRTGTAPTENLVLGQVLKTFLSNLLTELAQQANTDSIHTHIGNLGYNTTVPNQAANYSSNKTAYNNLKTSPVNNENILSDLAFTEK